jgi:hypothetical protein
LTSTLLVYAEVKQGYQLHRVASRCSIVREGTGSEMQRDVVVEVTTTMVMLLWIDCGWPSSFPHSWGKSSAQDQESAVYVAPLFRVRDCSVRLFLKLEVGWQEQILVLQLCNTL